jgi:putative oxidoreductase
MIRALYAVARIALAVVFVRSGWEVVRAPAKAAATAGPLLGTLRSKAPGSLPVPLPEDEQLVRANAAAQVAGGVLLASGIAPQLAAGVLMGSLVPTTFAGHSFWKHEDPAQRFNQRNHFNKNIGLFGGLLLVLLTGGKAGRK